MPVSRQGRCELQVLSILRAALAYAGFFSALEFPVFP